MLLWSTMLMLVVASGSAAIAADATKSDSPARPNIVLFLVDDMGWIDCGAYGSQYYETPNIDRLATRGMRFTDAYSANPLCSPTRASILSGKYPARLGLTTAAGHQPPIPADAPRYPENAGPTKQTIQPQSLRFLDPKEYTLAEALHDAGYRTGHFGKWHLGLTEEFWPDRQGFDVAWHGKPDPGPPGPNGYFSPYSFKAGTIQPGKPGQYIVDHLTDEAVKFIEENRSRPFYLQVWQFGVHGPWGHKEEYTRQFVDKKDPRGKQDNAVMASMLRSIDESLGRIVAKLDELGLTDNTIILFSSDNGGNVHSNTEEDRRGQLELNPKNPQHHSLLSYRKYAGFKPPTNNDPLRAGKGTLYEGGVRVPLVVVWPGRIEPGKESSQVVMSIDFYPTLLDLAGITRPARQEFDGMSIAPVLRNPDATLDRDTVFNYYPHGGPGKPPGVTVRRGDWKLIRWYETSEEYPSKHELYNLREDLGESKNLATENPDKVRELDGLIDGFLARTKALVPKPNPAYKPGAGKAVAAEQPLLRWVPKNSTAEIVEGYLHIQGEGRSPFLGTVSAKAPGPLELRSRLKSAAGGAGRVQWRTADQESFPGEGQTVSFTLKPGDWQEAKVDLPVKGQLVQMRLYVPAQEKPVDIDWIELWRSGEKPARAMRWDFGAE
ncbi:MAG: sulfatase [Planctomycetota bacterium]